MLFLQIVLGFFMLLGLRLSFDEPTHRDNYSSDYAPGATANAVEKLDSIRTNIGGATLAVCSALMLVATRISRSAKVVKSESRDESEVAPLREWVAPPPVASKPTPAPAAKPTRSLDQVLSQVEAPVDATQPVRLPGESPEQWAKRLEAAEIAAFKAKTGA